MKDRLANPHVTFDELVQQIDDRVSSALRAGGRSDVDDRVRDELAKTRAAWQLLLSGAATQGAAAETVGRRGLQTASMLIDTLPDPVAMRAALLLDGVRKGFVDGGAIRERVDAATAAMTDRVARFIGRTIRTNNQDVLPFYVQRLERLGGDPRIVAVALVDRLHQLRTLLDSTRRESLEFAQETLDWPSRLAEMTGLYRIKALLEDISFRIARPVDYQRVAGLVQSKLSQREERIRSLKAEIESLLADHQIRADVAGRSKHLYSIHRKMVDKESNYSELYDIEALRVIVDGPEEQIWEVLSLLTARWKSDEDRFKDYVSNPKRNGYRSLHLTLRDQGDRAFEVQCRTLAMHEEAESGFAAHWAYKEGTRVEEGQRDAVRGLRVDALVGTDADEAKTDDAPVVRPDACLFIVTPRGEEMPVAVGSTALDFAYAIHTNVGHYARSITVNGRNVELNHILQDGDRVEVQKAPTPQVNQDRLQFVTSHHAKVKINQYLGQARRPEKREQGKVLLADALRAVQLGVDDLTARPAFRRILADKGYPDLDALSLAVGQGQLSPATVVRWVQPRKRTQPPPSPERTTRPPGAVARVAVPTEFQGSIECGFAGCCEPMPPQPIVGYISGDGRIVVHRIDCANLTRPGSPLLERMTAVRWRDLDDADPHHARRYRIRVETTDRPHLLYHMTDTIASVGANIKRAVSRVLTEGKARNFFDIVVVDFAQVSLLLVLLRRIPGVDRALLVEDPWLAGPFDV